jgi:WD40 repeat protein
MSGRVSIILAALFVWLNSAQAQGQPQVIPQIGHSKIINSVAFSPDGRMIASGGQDASIKLWDKATGRLIHTFEGHADSV